jgi:ubiquinone/menaquinone biosynthesis C-methylase UbiE
MRRFHPDVLNKYYGCGSPIPDALRGKTVLDLGCGTGRDVFLVSVLAGRTGKAIGLDMTDEQLNVAIASVGHHKSTFPDASPVEFRKGFIEDLASAGLSDNSVDVVISNCVINLSSDKRKVFSEIYRVLQGNGEVLISDIFTNQPLPQAARDNKVLVGECLGNALDLTTFVEIMKDVGFTEIWPVKVETIPIEGISPEIIPPGTIFFQITFAAYKLKLEMESGSSGHYTAKYIGGIDECEDEWKFDLNHVFRKGEEVSVPSKLAIILGSRYGNHFEVRRSDSGRSRDDVKEFLETVYEVSQASTPSPVSQCCCCCDGCCGSD